MDEGFAGLPYKYQATNVDKAMTDHAQRARAVRALTCLYLQLPTSIADDVFKIVTEAFEEDDKRITQAHAAGRREGLEEAIQENCMYCHDPAWSARDTDDNHLSPLTGSSFPCASKKIRAKAKEEGL